MKISRSKGAIEAKVTGAFKKALPILCEEILADCNQYCKEREGALIASSLVHSRPQEGKLIWQTPYARRQYWEIQTAIKDKNPRASWKWCEVAKAHHKERWERQAQKLFEREL